MANFRRRRPRYKTPAHHESTTYWRKRAGVKPVILPEHPGFRSPPEAMEAWRRLFDGYPPYNLYSHDPGVWNRVFHNKPTRIRTRRVAKLIASGRVDPDDTVWPSHKKPTIYYW